MNNAKLRLLAGVASVAAIAGLMLGAERHISKSHATANRAAAKKNSTSDLAKARAIATAQPLAFEENRGQADAPVKFLARAHGYAAFLTPGATVLRVGDSAVSMQLKDGNAAPEMQGQELQFGKSNYLRGTDQSKWITGVPHFAKVRSKDVYPGIDTVYAGNERQIEYDFVVRPGADPSQIRMDFAGVSKLAINSNGDLELHTKTGVMLDHKPVVYQMVNGKRKPLSGDFTLLAKNEVGFKLGAYDAAQELVIDPTLTMGANLGGASNDEGFAVAANSTGIAITGRTQSTNIPNVPPGTGPNVTGSFPVLNALPGNAQHSVPGGSWDVFVTKFTIDASGGPLSGDPILAYSTFLGTPGDEAGEGVALDAAGNAYVAGYTNSSALFTATTGNPPFAGLYNAFVVELPVGGASLTAATYLGSFGTVTQAFSLALDPVSGNAVIEASLTVSPPRRVPQKLFKAAIPMGSSRHSPRLPWLRSHPPIWAAATTTR